MALTLLEARGRAALITVVDYEVHLTLAANGDRFGSTSVVRFTCSEAGASCFLELADGVDVTVTLNGKQLPPAAYDGRRITLPDLTVDNVALVCARLPYVTNGDGMHRFVDPVDGETYVSAYCGMDNAQRVFACFDQPDLKAPITLDVSADDRWTVLASGRRVEPHIPGRWRFAPTPPIPTYLFVVCAGPWHSTGFEHSGRRFGWHARQSLATELNRDSEELRRVTIACWDHYASVFREPYAFDDYHQVFVPGLNWGALETPGCVTYRDEMLPPGRISDQERQRRATVIAHEMAHMWFGNLVTMRWFDDAWLSESFADYMGFLVADRAAGFRETWVDFDAAFLPMAYDADERRSTHPVAPEPAAVTDVDAAYGNFDSLSYAKGNAVVRQLVTWLGEEDFLAGVNGYLTRHRFGTASLTDFVSALSDASRRDVAGWVDAWLRTTGFDTLTVTREAGVPVLSRTGSRPHRLRVTSYDVTNGALRPTSTRTVDLGDDPVSLSEGRDRVVVANSHGDTFARLRLDGRSFTAVTAHLSAMPDSKTRAVLWTALGDLVRRADGFDTLTVTREAGVPVLSRTGSRPHRLRVTSYDVTDGALRPASTRTVDVGDDPVRLPEGRDRVVVPNSHGDTFARLRLDRHSFTAVTAHLSAIPDPKTRAVLWTALGDLVRRAELDPRDYLDMVSSHLPHEGHSAVFEAALGRARRDVVVQYLPADRVASALDILAAACRGALNAASAPAVALAAVRGLASTSRDAALLRAWLADDRADTGIALDPRLRWDVLRRLAEIGDPAAPALVEAERRRDPSIAGELGTARASAALPDPAAKASAWNAMFSGEPSNRLFAETAQGFWSAEQHDLLAPYVERYLAEAPALAARRGQSFSLVVGHAFPTIPLGADALSMLDRALLGDITTVLRRAWEDRRDDLALAMAVRRRFG